METAYLGPAGTYTHEALLASAEAFTANDMGAAGARPMATIRDVVLAVQEGSAERGVVPIENSVEGSVNATLDALAFDGGEVRIIGETVLPIHHCLIGTDRLRVDDIEVVVSHPQALAQCAGFLRARVPRAELRSASSTAEAVRAVLAEQARWAALGPRSAAERYGGGVLVADVEDVVGNETRFVWLARADDARSRGGDRRAHKTAVAFWPREADHPGWLVQCLAEFSTRGVNLTRIESRPRKVGLGEYVFFVDLEGAAHDRPVRDGLRAVSAHVAQLRVLGSFPAA